MKKSLLIALVAIVGCAMTVSAQGRRGLRINEVMVQNDSSIIDEFGNHSAWIELFNSTYGPLEISSVYLTTDSTMPKMYPVPIGDVNTEIPTRQHVVFFADNKPNRGTFHTSFNLQPGKDNWIGVYDADGKTLIDAVVVPASLLPNQSYARAIDGEDNPDPSKTWEVRDDNVPGKYITPSSNNIIKAENAKVIRFSEEDENGLGLTLLAMGIVFSALLLLCICFYIISKIGEKRSTRRKMASQGIDSRSVPRAERPDDDSGEVIAAIVMALHEHLNTHDQESTILTIKKLRRAYSPWNSKIYGLREVPERPHKH